MKKNKIYILKYEACSHFSKLFNWYSKDSKIIVDSFMFINKAYLVAKILLNKACVQTSPYE